MRLLIDLTALSFTQLSAKSHLREPPTLGDQLLGLLVFQRLRNTLGERNILKHPTISRNLLVRCHFPGPLSERKRLAGIDWQWWFASEQVWIWEALQQHLTEAWGTFERYKRTISDHERLAEIGAFQGQLLQAFFDEADRVGRRDICLFALRGISTALQEFSPENEPWFHELRPRRMKMSDRQALYGQVLMPFAVLQRSAIGNRKRKQSATMTRSIRQASIGKLPGKMDNLILS